ncbi:hypothetical protein [Candidatus Nitronereus thalassa]|uniref:Uncharacterized protein n=1 Tax=Candidatus Nitronereus thalassa TaxID=3020898 RepID=A0ABU3K365_9BACT|nr:hypothetical protein [Candidatus Nitronereus thalassa]MDT7040833.1 hypothetical protein [Candidatus Nitronereus thalassa]
MSLPPYVYELGTAWSEETCRRLDQTFGRDGWTWYSPFKAEHRLGTLNGGRCWCCAAIAAARIAVNVRGHVAEYDMCCVHAAQYDNKTCDAPERRPQEKTVNA